MAAASPRASSRAVSTTDRPCSARRAASARPMPRFAPVTTATVSPVHHGAALRPPHTARVTVSVSYQISAHAGSNDLARARPAVHLLGWIRRRLLVLGARAVHGRRHRAGRSPSTSSKQACWSVEGEVRGWGGTGRRGEGAFIYRDGLDRVARLLAACQLRASTVGRQAGLLARELPVASGTERSKWVGAGGGSKCAGLVAVNVTQRTGRNRIR